MTTRADRLRLAALKDFTATYGHVVTAALRAYSEQMRRSASSLREGYDQIKDDPEARAAQDKTILPTAGILPSADVFQDSAKLGDRAMEAWENLLDSEEDPAGL